VYRGSLDSAIENVQQSFLDSMRMKFKELLHDFTEDDNARYTPDAWMMKTVDLAGPNGTRT
jgi:hypothetical protein